MQGLFIDLLDDVASQADFQVEYKPVSAGTLKEHNGDSWASCVHDVGRGHLDLCVGNFWETTMRRQVAQFSTTIFSDVFYMVVPLPREDNSVGAQMTKLFEPFTQNLWITIVCATIVVGFTYGVIDANDKSSMKSISQKISSSIYRAIMELMNGASFSEDQPIYHKSVTVTWAFFVLIIIVAYTANLAAFLGEEKVLHKVQSVDHCIEKNCNLCHPSDQVLNRLRVIYPALHRYQKVGGPEEVPILLADGTCDIFVGSKYTWSMQEAFWGNCETMFLGDYIFDFQVAWPVSPMVAAPISYWLGYSAEMEMFHKFNRQYQPSSPCETSVEIQRAEISAHKIGVTSITGPLFILGSGIAFGVVSRFGTTLLKKGKKQNPQEGTVDLSSTHETDTAQINTKLNGSFDLSAINEFDAPFHNVKVICSY